MEQQLIEQSSRKFQVDWNPQLFLCSQCTLIWTAKQTVEFQYASSCAAKSKEDKELQRQIEHSFTINWKFPELWNIYLPYADLDPSIKQKLKAAQGVIHLLVEKQTEQQQSPWARSTLSWAPGACSQRLPHIYKMVSLLQKHVRLANAASAVRCAYAILCSPVRYHTQLLLRRLIIIITEDAILHPFSEIPMVLLMLHSKHIELSNSQKEMILQIIQQVCATDVPADRRCKYHLTSQTLVSKEFLNKFSVLDSVRRDSIIQEIIKKRDTLQMTLFIRACYSGMPADVHLMFETLQVCSKRFNKLINQLSSIKARKDSLIQPAMQRSKEAFHEQFGSFPSLWRNWLEDDVFHETNWCLENEFQSLQDAWRLNPNDFLLTAIDMHCSNIVPDLMREFQIPLNERDKLESLLWERRSRLYNRPCSCESLANCYDHQDTVYPHLVQSSDPSWWKSMNRNKTDQGSTQAIDLPRRSIVRTLAPCSGMTYLDTYCRENWKRSLTNFYPVDLKNKSSINSASKFIPRMKRLRGSLHDLCEERHQSKITQHFELHKEHEVYQAIPELTIHKSNKKLKTHLEDYFAPNN